MGNYHMIQLSEQARFILKCLAEGQTFGEILHHQPQFTAEDIAKAAEEAVRLDNFQRETSSRKTGETNLRTYEVWTDAEDMTLHNMLSDNIAIQDIAKTLERHPMIVRRRIRQLNLDDSL